MQSETQPRLQEEKVPIVSITWRNFQKLKPVLHNALSTAEFISIDCELSGLGNRAGLRRKSVEERYKHMAALARSHALLSWGIACFSGTSAQQGALHDSTTSAPDAASAGKRSSSGTERLLDVATFEVLLACQDDYVVEPGSLAFLAQHGFDFNKQIRLGMPYSKQHRSSSSPAAAKRSDATEATPARREDGKQVTDPASTSKKQSHVPSPFAGGTTTHVNGSRSPASSTSAKPSGPDPHAAKEIFDMVLAASKPIVVHNGLIDLVFLYQSLYGELPATLAQFVADLSEMFPCIIDTKVLADFVVREPASFLEYLYRKTHRKMSNWTAHNRVLIRSGTFTALSARGRLPPCVDMVTLPRVAARAVNPVKANVCQRFANHGFCAKGRSCAQSHDIDLILDVEEHSRRRRQKRPADKADHDGVPQDSGDLAHDGSPNPKQPRLESSVDSGQAASNGSVAAAAGSQTEMLQHCTSTVASARSQGHRAGFDSFMTGFIFAAYQTFHGSAVAPKGKGSLYLTGKPRPLSILKSSFTSCSDTHIQRQTALSSTTASK